MLFGSDSGTFWNTVFTKGVFKCEIDTRKIKRIATKSATLLWMNAHRRGASGRRYVDTKVVLSSN
jgi:hypothetical protein